MATIKDIAEAAGVSTGTVDRIIHSRGRYSEETAETVKKVMEKLNYTPNIHARGLKRTKMHNFGVVIPMRHQDGGYWSLVEKGILRASRELISYGSKVTIFFFDNYSEKSCRETLRSALNSDVEGLLIAPSRSEDMKKLLPECRIPFLFIDSDIPNLKRRLTYIGQDSHQSGILSAKLMGLLLAARGVTGTDPTILIVDPPASNYHLKSRIDGFRTSISNLYQEVKTIVLKEDVDDERKVHSFLEKFWNEQTSLPDGIFVANSSVYYMASFLEKKGEDACAVPLIGYDILPGRESAVEKGIIDFILTQQPETQGYRGIMMLYNSLVLNKEVKNEIITPLNIITKENIHTFLEENLLLEEA